MFNPLLLTAGGDTVLFGVTLSLSQVLLDLSLAFVMWGLGMTLTVSDFKRILNHPKAVLMGLGNQMIALPALGFLLAFLLAPSPEIQVGIIVLTACPGGATSNLVSHLLKGNVALSILLTAANSFLILISVPLLVSLALAVFMSKSEDVQLDISNTLQEISLAVLVPVALGMAVKYFFPRFSEKAETPMKWLMPMAMAASFVYIMFFKESADDQPRFDLVRQLPILGIAFLLNISAILTGFNVPKLINVGFRSRLTIGIEVGLQNSLLALTIANNQLENQRIAEMSVVYGSITFVTTVGTVFLLQRFAERKQSR